MYCRKRDTLLRLVSLIIGNRHTIFAFAGYESYPSAPSTYHALYQLLTTYIISNSRCGKLKFKQRLVTRWDLSHFLILVGGGILLFKLDKAFNIAKMLQGFVPEAIKTQCIDDVYNFWYVKFLNYSVDVSLLSDFIPSPSLEAS